MILNTITKRLNEFSASKINLPYAVQHFKIDINPHISLPQEFLGVFTEGIAFYITKPYTLEDYRNYLVNSKEYHNIHDEDERIEYMYQNLLKKQDADNMIKWQNEQVYVALGIVMYELITASRSFEELSVEKINLLRELLKIEKGILIEMIVF